jgi:prepilin-type N-terminal cleavage/methylation domain-containing protein
MQRPSRTRRRESGFSLLEMMLATVILLVGLVAVAQLVPASILLNYRNRTDSSALVFAQREMDQFLDQPLSSPAFTDAQGYFCQLGNAATTNVVVGSPLVNNQALIDFNQALVPNYSYATPFIDPNDPSGTGYDVRWAVIVTGNGTAVSSKRFILGIRQQGGSGYFQPVTLDMMVGK